MNTTNDFVNTINLHLLKHFDVSDIQIITHVIQEALLNYNITPMSTDLILYDNRNNDLIVQYASNLLLQGKSKGTIKMYSREIRKFFEIVNKSYKDVTSNDVKGYLASLLNRGISKRTTNNSKNYLASFFRWLLEEDLINKNPCATVKQIKFNRELKDSFSDIEIDKIRSSISKTRDRAIVEVLLSSGVRVTELIHLNISDIDFNSFRVKVRGGKGDKDRITYISNVASSRLKEYLDSRSDDNEALFVGRTNERLSVSSIRKVLKCLEPIVDVGDMHPHKFRHTFATTLYRNGMNLHEIQLLLGHSNIETTMLYITADDKSIGGSYAKYMT